MTKNFWPSLLPSPRGKLQVDTSLGTKLKLSLVLPTYQEAANLPLLIPLLTEILEQTLGESYELIVVDDDSPDYSWKIALELGANYPQVKVIRRLEEKGLATAIIRGWQAGSGEVLGVIDADLQHPPEVLSQLWEQIKQGADLAVASRHLEGGGVSEWSLSRRVLSRGAQTIGLLLLPEVVGRVSDPLSGYFLVRREAIAARVLNPMGYKILIEILGRGKIREIAETAYIFREREMGNSKVTKDHYWQYLYHLLRLRLAIWPLGRFLRFGTVGLSGVFVDFGSFYLLRTTVGLAITTSVILSTEIAILNNFLWNDLWTFRDLSRSQRSWSQTGKRLLKFNLICLMGLILQVLLVSVGYKWLGLNEYLAKLIAIILVTLWNFWLNLKLNWRVTEMSKNR